MNLPEGDNAPAWTSSVRSRTGAFTALHVAGTVKYLVRTPPARDPQISQPLPEADGSCSQTKSKPRDTAFSTPVAAALPLSCPVTGGAAVLNVEVPLAQVVDSSDGLVPAFAVCSMSRMLL